MDHEDRRIIAVCTSWEDVENLNLVLNCLIDTAESRHYLPLCVAFDRNSVEAREEESVREFMAAFNIPNLAGILLFGEMIRSDTINEHIIRLAHRKKLPVFMLEREYSPFPLNSFPGNPAAVCRPTRSYPRKKRRAED